MLELFIACWGFRWFIWEYKLLADLRDKLATLHPCLHELVICPYCQMFEIFLVMFMLFLYAPPHVFHYIKWAGIGLSFAWFSIILSMIETILENKVYRKD